MPDQSDAPSPDTPPPRRTPADRGSVDLAGQCELAAIGLVEDGAPEDAGPRPELTGPFLARGRQVSDADRGLPRCAPAGLQPGTSRCLHAVDELGRVVAALRVQSPDEAGEASPLRLKVQVSAGGSLASRDDTPESLFERADGALYSAKRDGRDRIAIAE